MNFATTIYNEKSREFELFRGNNTEKKNQFNKKVCAALMEFCPQYCARIATEIYDK